MSRRDDIINELEIDYGVQLHANDIPDILCLNDTCIHEGCSCWQEFRQQVEAVLKDQSKAEEAQAARSAKMLNKSNLRRAA